MSECWVQPADCSYVYVLDMGNNKPVTCTHSIQFNGMQFKWIATMKIICVWLIELCSYMLLATPIVIITVNETWNPNNLGMCLHALRTSYQFTFFKWITVACSIRKIFLWGSQQRRWLYSSRWQFMCITKKLMSSAIEHCVLFILFGSEQQTLTNVSVRTNRLPIVMVDSILYVFIGNVCVDRHPPHPRKFNFVVSIIFATEREWIYNWMRIIASWKFVNK